MEWIIQCLVFILKYLVNELFGSWGLFGNWLFGYSGKGYLIIWLLAYWGGHVVL